MSLLRNWYKQASMPKHASHCWASEGKDTVSMSADDSSRVGPVNPGRMRCPCFMYVDNLDFRSP